MRRKGGGGGPAAIASLGDPGNSESATGVEKKEGDKRGKEGKRREKEPERGRAIKFYAFRTQGRMFPRKSVCALDTGEESIYVYNSACILTRSTPEGRPT